MTTLYNPTTAGPLLYNVRTNAPGLSRQRVLRLIEAGILRAVRAGNGWVIEAAEVERFNALERGKEK